MWVAGVDGCSAGWFRACRRLDGRGLDFRVVGSAAELLSVEPVPDVVAIDVPIGLPERGPRACDREARGLLGARRSSVFPAPVRAAIGATTHEEASARSAAASGRRVAAPTFHILR